MPQKFAYFPLGGGLDLITPAIAQKPGGAIGALNYESAANGYRRVEGFERFDGHPSPTDAPYYELDFTDAIDPFLFGDVINGATSGAFGTVLADSVVTSGSLGAGDAAGYVGLGPIIGNFIDGEPLQIAGGVSSSILELEDDVNIVLEDDSDLLLETGTTVDLEAGSTSTDFLLEDGITTLDTEGTGGIIRARANGTQQPLIAPDDATARVWQAAATSNARGLIHAPMGSGPARGVWEYRGTIYTFRDSLDGTHGQMWKSSASGWVLVPLGYIIDFTSGGTVTIDEGDTITGATSAATALVNRIVTTSGSWSAGTAAGYLILSSVTGVFVAENLNIGANLDVATIASDKAAITLPPGGRYQLINYNFYGASQTLRMYGVNGVGPGFEFDGTTFTPIRSGMTVDTPIRVAEHKEHLFLAFPGGAFQNSSIGAPLDWSAITGAAAYGMGDEITDFLSNNSRRPDGPRRQQDREPLRHQRRRLPA
jgi:hypothetical protein